MPQHTSKTKDKTMIYQSIMDKVGRKSKLLGLAGELDALKTDLSSLMVANKGVVTAAVGPPAGSTRATKAETIEKLTRYDKPNDSEVQAILAGLSVGELVKLTRESIKLKKDLMPPEPSLASPASFLSEPLPPLPPLPSLPAPEAQPMPPIPAMPEGPMPQGSIPQGPVPVPSLEPQALAPQGPGPLPLEQPSLPPSF